MYPEYCVKDVPGIYLCNAEGGTRRRSAFETLRVGHSLRLFLLIAISYFALFNSLSKKIAMPREGVEPSRGVIPNGF